MKKIYLLKWKKYKRQQTLPVVTSMRFYVNSIDENKKKNVEELDKLMVNQ